MVDFNKLFYYKDGKLYNKESRNYNSLKDAEVGTTNSNGYCVLKVYGKVYLTHRVIWEMHYGGIESKLEIDHINHNKKDNRLSNLRKVSKTDNQRNQAGRGTSISGVLGVTWHKKMKKWWAQVTVGGEVKNLGKFTDLSTAERAVKEARLTYKFHTNHGSNNYE